LDAQKKDMKLVPVETTISRIFHAIQFPWQKEILDVRMRINFGCNEEERKFSY